MTHDADELLRLQRDVERLANVLDDQFCVPGTSLRFGLDGVIGLIPGIGDLFTAAISTYLIGIAHQAGASAWLKTRMAANVGIDTTLGAIPVVGDAFDFAFKANRANTRLLATHIDKRLEELGARASAPIDDDYAGPTIDIDPAPGAQRNR